MADFYFAKMNDDGTYSKPKKWEGVLEITPITSSGEKSDAEQIDLFTTEEITFECDPPGWFFLLMVYMNMAQDRSCRTCRNCKEMYRYPDYVDAEECICTKGLECDTWFDRVKDCPQYDYRLFREPMQRNPDLDKYPHAYITKGDYEDV